MKSGNNVFNSFKFNNLIRNQKKSSTPWPGLAIHPQGVKFLVTRRWMFLGRKCTKGAMAWVLKMKLFAGV
jgi:hypothetical protein